MTLNNFAYYFMIAYVQPFKSELQNKVARVTELFFSVGLLLMITYPLLEDSISIQTYKSIGWIICVLFVLAPIIEITAIFIETA
jgi:hypothetical protein